MPSLVVSGQRFAFVLYRAPRNFDAFVIDDRWISRDRLEWTLTRTSANGRILQTIQGVVSR